MNQDHLEKLIATIQEEKGAKFPLKVDKRLSGYIEKYEKLRNIVGFHDEHVWRQYAISRIIKRQIHLTLSGAPRADTLLHELVLAGYISEKKVTQIALNKVDAIIEKYMRGATIVRKYTQAQEDTIHRWLFSLMAVEIEDVLGLLAHERALIEAMQFEIETCVQFPKGYCNEDQKQLFITLAVSRSLIQADNGLIAYFLIKEWYPTWVQSGEGIEQVMRAMWELKTTLSLYEKHPFHKHLMRVVTPFAVVFQTLDEVIKKHNGNLDDLKAKVYAVLHTVYVNLQTKVYRQIWNSFLYLVITKFILVLLVEYPYDVWKIGSLDITLALINIIAPVVLLLVLTVTIRVSDGANTQMLIKEVVRLVKAEKTQLETLVEHPKKRTLARRVVFNIFFVGGYLITYGLMIWALGILNFHSVAGFIFIVFITLVTYLAIRIRFTAERFRIVESRTRIRRDVMYLFALPLLLSGQWIVARFSRYNVIIIVFDLFFEAPFKMFVFLFRDFSDFAREKRELIE